MQERRAPPRVQPGQRTAARIRLFVPSQAWGGRRRREVLLAAFAGAVLFHAALVTAVVEAPRLWPHPPVSKVPPKHAADPPEADLVMVKENTPTVGGTPPPEPAKPSPPPKPQAPAGGGEPSTLNAPDGPPVPPPAQDQKPDPGRSEQGHATDVTPPPAPPTPPASSIQVNLDLDGEPGWGLVNDRVIAASPDDHFINKPAAYPRAAGMRGEEGTVYLSTLVAPDGHVEQVQIEQSSGYHDLDAAARNAVSAWHFRPAIRGGIAVESEMRMAYRFSIRD